MNDQHSNSIDSTLFTALAVLTFVVIEFVVIPARLAEMHSASQAGGAV